MSLFMMVAEINSFCSAGRILLYASLHNAVVSVHWSSMLPAFREHGFANVHHLSRPTQQTEMFLNNLVLQHINFQHFRERYEYLREQ